MKKTLRIPGIVMLMAGGVFLMPSHSEDEIVPQDPLATMETRGVDEINPSGRQYPRGGMRPFSEE